MKSFETLRVAIVGCGRMGQIRAASAAALGARVVGVVDMAAQRRSDLATRHPGCRALANADELDFSQLDAVFVCTPPSARGCVEIDALQQGVAVFVEKPVGLSSESMAALDPVLLENRIPTAVGYMNRYRTSVQRAKRELSAAPVLGFSAHWLVGAYNVPWWGQKMGSGGPINEQATHVIDLARYLLGDIVKVQALGRPLTNSPDLHGSASVSLGFSSGVLGSFIYSCEAEEKMIGLQAFTTTQAVKLNDWDFRWGADGPASVDRNQIFVDETNAFLQDLLAFREGEIATPRAVLCDFEDALATQRVVDALHEALATGDVVTVQPKRLLVPHSEVANGG